MKREVTLTFPDSATDMFGNTGYWTLIYNQVIVLARNMICVLYFIYNRCRRLMDF